MACPPTLLPLPQAKHRPCEPKLPLWRTPVTLFGICKRERLLSDRSKGPRPLFSSQVAAGAPFRGVLSYIRRLVCDYSAKSLCFCATVVFYLRRTKAPDLSSAQLTTRPASSQGLEGRCCVFKSILWVEKLSGTAVLHTLEHSPPPLLDPYSRQGRGRLTMEVL